MWYNVYDTGRIRAVNHFPSTDRDSPSLRPQDGTTCQDGVDRPRRERAFHRCIESAAHCHRDCRMVRIDSKGSFVREERGFFNKSRYYRFHTGGSCTQAALSEVEYRSLLGRQRDMPAQVMLDTESRKRRWMFRGNFYWEDEGYSETEMKALIIERIRRRERKIARAISHMEAEESKASTTREPIPDDVKVFVWRRDGGSCIKCGSRENLEYDHIIPISKGGSSTARNIQLLCDACNRSKGGNLV